jgi:hypothetical protein
MAQEPAGWPDAEHRAFNVRMNEKDIEYYVEKTAEAQAALVLLQGYVPEVRSQITAIGSRRLTNQLSRPLHPSGARSLTGKPAVHVSSRSSVSGEVRFQGVRDPPGVAPQGDLGELPQDRSGRRVDDHVMAQRHL